MIAFMIIMAWLQDRRRRDRDRDRRKKRGPVLALMIIIGLVLFLGAVTWLFKKSN